MKSIQILILTLAVICLSWRVSQVNDTLKAIQTAIEAKK